MSDKACIHGYTHCDKCPDPIVVLVPESVRFMRAWYCRVGSTDFCTRCMTRDGHQADCSARDVEWFFVELTVPYHTFMITSIRDPEHPSPPKDPDPC